MLAVVVVNLICNIRITSVFERLPFAFDRIGNGIKGLAASVLLLKSSQTQRLWVQFGLCKTESCGTTVHIKFAISPKMHI